MPADSYDLKISATAATRVGTEADFHASFAKSFLGSANKKVAVIRGTGNQTVTITNAGVVQVPTGTPAVKSEQGAGSNFTKIRGYAIVVRKVDEKLAATGSFNCNVAAEGLQNGSHDSPPFMDGGMICQMHDVAPTPVGTPWATFTFETAGVTNKEFVLFLFGE